MKEVPPEDGHGLPATSGVITSISAQKKNTRRLSVFLDGHFAFGVHQDVLLEHALHAGQHLDDTQVRALIEADTFIRAKEAAMFYLGYRARTEFEIKKKLREKGFSEDTSDRVIDRLRSLSYVDDEGFARDFVKDRFRTKGHGPQRLRADLRRAGVNPNLIDQAIEECLDGDDLLEAAMELAEKRWPRLASESNPTKKRHKLYSYLLRRGHAPETAREAVARMNAENGDGGQAGC